MATDEPLVDAQTQDVCKASGPPVRFQRQKPECGGGFDRAYYGMAKAAPVHTPKMHERPDEGLLILGVFDPK